MAKAVTLPTEQTLAKGARYEGNRFLVCGSWPHHETKAIQQPEFWRAIAAATTRDPTVFVVCAFQTLRRQAEKTTDAAALLRIRTAQALILERWACEECAVLHFVQGVDYDELIVEPASASRERAWACSRRQAATAARLYV
jgi:hypothetical protein